MRKECTRKPGFIDLGNAHGLCVLISNLRYAIAKRQLYLNGHRVHVQVLLVGVTGRLGGSLRLLQGGPSNVKEPRTLCDRLQIIDPGIRGPPHAPGQPHLGSLHAAVTWRWLCLYFRYWRDSYNVLYHIRLGKTWADSLRRRCWVERPRI